MIVQSFGHDGAANLSFTVPREGIEKSVSITEKISHELGCDHVSYDSQVAKLSVSGIGLRSHTDVAIRMFRALSDSEINLAMISTSEIRVNVVVDGADAQRALDCLNKAFADVIL